MFYRLHFTDFQPTAENMVVYFADILHHKLPEEVELESVVLYETANSYAEWLSSDN